MQSTNRTDRTPGKTLILVHGRGFKPGREDLAALWNDALRAGLVREFPQLAAALAACRNEFVYYGDELRSVLQATGRNYDAALDLADLGNTLAALTALSKTKQFRREFYERLPGKTPLKEFLADIGAPALTVLGLKERAIGRLLPELLDYWRNDHSPLRGVAARLCETVATALLRGDDVLLLSHCIGSVLAYDALWKLSRGAGADAQRLRGRKVGVWLTLGSPLGDESVKQRLEGASEPRERRHPDNVINWINVAAEDDYVCHDGRIANDYRAMLDARLVSRIDDMRIYNMAVRYGRSNPHNALGYLAHPRVGRIVAQWLAPDGVVEPPQGPDDFDV